MSTIAHLAEEAAEADRARLAAEEAAAFELADLMAAAPMDLAGFKEAARREQQRAKDAAREAKRRRERAARDRPDAPPQVFPPPFAIPRSFALDAISATYHPSQPKRLVVPRPSRSTYTLPAFAHAMLHPMGAMCAPAASANAGAGRAVGGACSVGRSPAVNPSPAVGPHADDPLAGTAAVRLGSPQPAAALAPSSGSFIASRGPSLQAPPPLSLHDSESEGGAQFPPPDPSRTTQTYRVPMRSAAGAALHNTNNSAVHVVGGVGGAADPRVVSAAASDTSHPFSSLGDMQRRRADVEGSRAGVARGGEGDDTEEDDEGGPLRHDFSTTAPPAHPFTAAVPAAGGFAPPTVANETSAGLGAGRASRHSPSPHPHPQNQRQQTPNATVISPPPLKARAPDSDVVVLHGLYSLPPSLVPLLDEADAQAKVLIERRMGRLCAPYGVRASLDSFTKAMFHTAAPLIGTNTNANAGASAAKGQGQGPAAPAASGFVSVVGSPTFGVTSATHSYANAMNNTYAYNGSMAGLPSAMGGVGGGGDPSALSMSNVNGLLSTTMGGNGGGLPRGVSFRRGGDDMMSPNASFAAFPANALASPTSQHLQAPMQQQQRSPLYILHTVPTGGPHAASHSPTPSPPSHSPSPLEEHNAFRTLVEAPTAMTIGKGGHWDSAASLKGHMERMEASVTVLRSALKDLFETFKDEPLFGPLIGFELNHAVLLWGRVKGRLIARRKMAEFRDRREFFDDKSAAACAAQQSGAGGGAPGSSDGGSNATGANGGKVGAERGVFSRNGSPLSLLTTASATLARYGGVLGALDYICKHLITPEQFADSSVVPLTLHYAVARAQSNAALGGGGGADPFNMSFAGGFNPNASFRKAGSPIGTAAAASNGGWSSPTGGGAQEVLMCSRDNAYRVSNLVSALFAALEAFRWEFDVVDESVLTVEAIESGLRIALDWLRSIHE